MDPKIKRLLNTTCYCLNKHKAHSTCYQLLEEKKKIDNSGATVLKKHLPSTTYIKNLQKVNICN